MKIKAEKGQTVLQAALEKDIYISNLCYNPDLKPFGACRLCMVEDEEGTSVYFLRNSGGGGDVLAD